MRLVALLSLTASLVFGNIFFYNNFMISRANEIPSPTLVREADLYLNLTFLNLGIYTVLNVIIGMEEILSRKLD